MTLTFEKCKQLKEANFPQNKKIAYVISPLSSNKTPFLLSMHIDEKMDGYANLIASGYEVYACPDLSELIKECGGAKKQICFHLEGIDGYWHSASCAFSVLLPPNERWKEYKGWSNGDTPEEAVSNLWLEINKKR